ncbi:hypothetical protein JI747_016210 [Chryseobacterium sp. RG1]|uniref:Uncharacterized protein n=1 Tax=Chryseobacterium tagetis TaxID=2801334 RepID=A0ABS8A437_9FLAO|nr:hypothetical protein [Chryseobacterium tagetis]MCA6068713.1 hypothetical protein [Chryseobacterium tagetis]
MDNERLWATELYKLYVTKNIDNIKNKLFNSTDLLVYLHEILTEENVQLESNDIYSEQLILKFHLQNLSLLDLSEGHSIKSKYYKNRAPHIKFLDISSVITIVRSQYESLLMYQHLYVNSSISEENQLRFDSWMMSSMMLRSKVFSDPEKADHERLTDEKVAIDNFRKSISNNPTFKTLSEKQQKSLLENGSGKLFKTWDTIMSESKFNSKGMFSKIYFIASVYAHSEGIMAIQLKQSKHLMDHPFMKENLYLMLFYSYLMTNVMTKNIINKFPEVKKRYDDLDEKVKFEINFNYQLAFK